VRAAGKWPRANGIGGAGLHNTQAVKFPARPNKLASVKYGSGVPIFLSLESGGRLTLAMNPAFESTNEY